jgi:hypothetical protein
MSSMARPLASRGTELFVQPLASAPIDWCEMRRAIARVARRENARWTRPDGSKLAESDPNQLRILAQYWSTVPGFGSASAAMRAARRSAAGDPLYSWSAAFVCFVMHTARVRRAHGFMFGPRHLDYIVGSLRNRERSDRTRPFWLVDHVELQREAAPESGDLLCFNRSSSRHTYASLRRQYWSGGRQSRSRPPRGVSHCAIVVGTGNTRGRRFIETIGGNEGAPSSVRLRRRIADQFGNIPNPQAHRIFGLIKLIECQRLR